MSETKSSRNKDQLQFYSCTKQWKEFDVTEMGSQNMEISFV